MSVPPAEREAAPSDAELVHQAAAGDRAALASLYDRYASMLLAVGQRMLKSRREAEDLLHDVFLEVWRQAKDYDPSRGSVRCWLVLRLRSRALDRLKSAGYARVVSIDADAPGYEEPSVGPFDPTVGSDYALVRRALEGLAPDQRTVLDLAYFEGLSLSEIAEKQGVPLGTIKSRLARALGRLRDEMAIVRGGES